MARNKEKLGRIDGQWTDGRCDFNIPPKYYWGGGHKIIRNRK